MQESEVERIGDFHVSKAAGTQPKGVVLLLGWSDGALKNLLKYAAVYRDRGYRVVMARSQIADWMAADDKFVRRYADLVPILSDLQCLHGQQHSALVHMFSNGGARTWWGIQQALDEQGVKLRTAGIIIDSAPGVPRVWQGATFFSLAIPNAVLRAVARPLLALLLLLLGFLSFTPLGRLWRGMNKFEGVWAGLLRSDQKNTPRLFIYSKTDQLVSHTDVETCIEKTKAGGVSLVRVLCFDKSEHVRHLAEHPEQYTGAIDRFLEGDCGFVSPAKNDKGVAGA